MPCSFISISLTLRNDKPFSDGLKPSALRRISNSVRRAKGDFLACSAVGVTNDDEDEDEDEDEEEDVDLVYFSWALGALDDTSPPSIYGPSPFTRCW